MEVTLLGTGAADGIPALFADSRVSRHAREHGGKDIRTRTSALVDGVLKIDLPPDTLTQITRCNVNPADWTGIVFTHSDDDHLARNEIQYALYPFTSAEFPGFTIYGNETVCAKIQDRYPDWPFEIVRTCSFVPFTHAGYTITPIKANHKLDEDSQNLVIQRDGRTFLYGTDTGVWSEETWEFLADWHLDGLVLECTDGFHKSDYFGHMDITQCLGMITRLRESGIAQPHTVIYTTHHGHTGDATHAQLEEALRPSGVEPGFDGVQFVV